MYIQRQEPVPEVFPSEYVAPGHGLLQVTSGPEVVKLYVLAQTVQTVELEQVTQWDEQAI